MLAQSHRQGYVQRTGPVTESADQLGARLRKAVQEGDLQRCRALVLAGADLAASDEDGWTALHIAAVKEHSAITRLLLESGSPVGARGGKGSWTALHLAARKGNAETAKALLEAGAEVNGRIDKGWTALHLAAWYNQLGAVTSVLMQHGADVNAVTDKGKTALELARQKKHTAIEVQLMALDAGVRSGWVESKVKGDGDG